MVTCQISTFRVLPVCSDRILGAARSQGVGAGRAGIGTRLAVGQLVLVGTFPVLRRGTPVLVGRTLVLDRVAIVLGNVARMDLANEGTRVRGLGGLLLEGANLRNNIINHSRHSLHTVTPPRKSTYLCLLDATVASLVLTKHDAASIPGGLHHARTALDLRRIPKLFNHVRPLPSPVSDSVESGSPGDENLRGINDTLDLALRE